MISIDFQQFLQHQEMAAPGPIEVLLHCLPNQQRRWRLVRSQWPDAPDSDVHCHPEVDVAETQALGDCARPAAAAADQSHWSHFCCTCCCNPEIACAMAWICCCCVCCSCCKVCAICPMCSWFVWFPCWNACWTCWTTSWTTCSVTCWVPWTACPDAATAAPSWLIWDLCSVCSWTIRCRSCWSTCISFCGCCWGWSAMISEMKIAPLTARNVKITPLRVQNPVTTRPKNPLKLIVPLVAPQMHVASFCRSMAWCASLSDTTHEIPVRLGDQATGLTPRRAGSAMPAPLPCKWVCTVGIPGP